MASKLLWEGFMHMKLPCRLVFLFLVLLLLVSLAGAQTLSVSVFEKDGNITPVPDRLCFRQRSSPQEKQGLTVSSPSLIPELILWISKF